MCYITVLEGCISQYTRLLYWRGASQYTRLLYWRDASQYTRLLYWRDSLVNTAVRITFDFYIFRL